VGHFLRICLTINQAFLRVGLLLATLYLLDRVKASCNAWPNRRRDTALQHVDDLGLYPRMPQMRREDLAAKAHVHL
jgi:hypothetical protein